MKIDLKIFIVSLKTTIEGNLFAIGISNFLNTHVKQFISVYQEIFIAAIRFYNPVIYHLEN